LLTVAQGGVENQDLVFHGFWCFSFVRCGRAKHTPVERKRRHPDVQTFIAFLAGAASGVAALGCWRWRTGARRLFASNPARARDLQLHEEADRALKQSEENFRQFFDTIEDFLFVLDDAGDILKVNRAVTARLGYDEHELLGRNILSLHPDGEPGQASAVLADLRAGKASYCTTPLQTKAGRLIPIEAREVRGTWNGQPVAFCIAKDIAGVKISEEKFAKAFHGSPALMALIRMDDLTVFDVNQALLDILGYSREEAIGKRPTELNLFVDVQQRDGLVDAMLHGRQPREVEVQLRSRSGQILDGLVSTEMLSLSHESLIMAVMVDVTERKRGEAALRRAAAELERKNQELAIARDAALDASRVKSQFLANMSHEIRTPLNGMLGLTELLSRSPLSSDQQEYVDSITRCGDLLLTILNDLLDFSKIEAGRLQIESIPFDLPGLIFDVVDFYGTKASPADVELVVDFDPALPTGFLGDPGRLRQVLGNLVSNAVKFTSKGQILIKAKQERRDAGKVALSIAVSDTGEGIPEEAQGRLFQPFTQADASTSRKHGGTGLGLALCKRIVEGMGGQIALRSRPGQGATLTVTVELPIDENRSSSLPPLAGTRCLLVDDNALVRDAMGKQLRRLGVQVATADSGEFAITAAGVSLQDGRPYDLVLVDFHMPGLGGERLAKVLRSDAGAAGLAPGRPGGAVCGGRHVRWLPGQAGAQRAGREDLDHGPRKQASRAHGRRRDPPLGVAAEEPCARWSHAAVSAACADRRGQRRESAGRAADAGGGRRLGHRGFRRAAGPLGHRTGRFRSGHHGLSNAGARRFCDHGADSRAGKIQRRPCAHPCGDCEFAGWRRGALPVRGHGRVSG
jgi:PAS domain S-box-containing protein